MKGSKTRRLAKILIGALVALALYFGAYYACVSIHFRRALEYKVQNMETAYAKYAIGPEWFMRLFFEPARLCDTYYLRPTRWEDRKSSNQVRSFDNVAT